MVEIIKKLIDLAADFINTMFEWQIEWEAGQTIAIGKIVVAFIFIAFALYMILDALGILDKED